MKITNARSSGQQIQYAIGQPLENQPLAYGHVSPGSTVEHVCRIPDEHLIISLEVGLDTGGCGKTIGDMDIAVMKTALCEIWNLTKSPRIREQIELIENTLDDIH
jgi:hypothetical protein